MGRFAYKWRRKFPSGWNASGLATCKECGAYVGIDSDPWPNGIDTGGPAIAVDCPAGFKAVYGRDPIPGVDFDPDDPLCQDDYEYFSGTGRYKS